MDRVAFLRSLINTQGRGLEIGAGYNPLVPRSEGFDVEVADHLDAAGLRAKYADSAHADAGRIEEVDYVLDTGSLTETIGRQPRYDYIVASHVIEHTPDMLGFLKDCEALLRPGGILLLAIPDKRHCFDVFQSLSSTGSIIQAHLERRKGPPVAAIFDDRAYNAVRGDAIGWSPQSAEALRFFLDAKQAHAIFQGDKASSHYIDVHVWKFVPSSFRLIARDLHGFGELRLREEAFFDSVGNEFYITLSEQGEGCPTDRLTLARRVLAEQATIVIGDLPRFDSISVS